MQEKRLLAQEVLKSRLLLSPFEEFALTLDFKLSKVARAAAPPLLPPLPTAPTAAPGNHPNRFGAFFAWQKTAAHFEARNSRPGSCYSVINMNYV